MSLISDKNKIKKDHVSFVKEGSSVGHCLETLKSLSHLFFFFPLFCPNFLVDSLDHYFSYLSLISLFFLSSLSLISITSTVSPVLLPFKPPVPAPPTLFCIDRGGMHFAKTLANESLMLVLRFQMCGGSRM